KPSATFNSVVARRALPLRITFGGSIRMLARDTGAVSLHGHRLVPACSPTTYKTRNLQRHLTA
ncbi:MAG: hypothetical protein AAB422_01445, partial [Planctomycetota bacterium]